MQFSQNISLSYSVTLNNVKINFGLTRDAVSRGELELQVQSFQINVSRRCRVGVPQIISAEIYF